jgi:hypothetical protein
VPRVPSRRRVSAARGVEQLPEVGFQSAYAPRRERSRPRT